MTILLHAPEKDIAVAIDTTDIPQEELNVLLKHIVPCTLVRLSKYSTDIYACNDAPVIRLLSSSEMIKKDTVV